MDRVIAEKKVKRSFIYIISSFYSFLDFFFFFFFLYFSFLFSLLSLLFSFFFIKLNQLGFKDRKNRYSLPNLWLQNWKKRRNTSSSGSHYDKTKYKSATNIKINWRSQETLEEDDWRESIAHVKEIQVTYFLFFFFSFSILFLFFI